MPRAYQNGTFCDESDICISPRDLGLLRGYGVFDVMPVYRGRPFQLPWHYARLTRSAEILRLRLPMDEIRFSEIITELIRQVGETEVIIRTVLSAGPSTDGFRPMPGQENFFMLVEPTHPLNPSVYRDGVSLITLEFERSLPQVKFANHAIAIQDLDRRDAAGAYETLYVSRGMVSECSQSNLFWVKDGSLSTTWDNVLWGITQRLVIELAEARGKKTAQKSVSLSELLQADEVFITGSSKAIVPVVSIDGQLIGKGTVGPITIELMAAYQQYRDQY